MRRSSAVMEVRAIFRFPFFFLFGYKQDLNSFHYLIQFEFNLLFLLIGLSPDLHSMEQIRRIMRPTDVPDTGLLCDLLWSDPDKDVQGWGENDRGVSFTFGADVVTKFLHRHDLDLICRAHQVVEDGYEFFAKRQLVTLFSAPNYCGEFDNAGGMMSVDETLMCSFQVSTHLKLFACLDIVSY